MKRVVWWRHGPEHRPGPHYQVAPAGTTACPAVHTQAAHQLCPHQHGHRCEEAVTLQQHHVPWDRCHVCSPLLMESHCVVHARICLVLPAVSV